MNKRKIKFYRTKSFVKLSREWQRKLEEDKFPEIESKWGLLISQDTRTIGYANACRISDFYSMLGNFISHKKLPIEDKKILSLYMEDKSIQEIADAMGRGTTKIKTTIRRYKAEVLQARK